MEEHALLTKLKIKVQLSVSEVARLAHRVGLTPNSVSVIGFLLAVLSAALYCFWELNAFFIPLATVFLLFSGLCDVLDGTMATLYGKTTTFGGFLDSLLDRYSDALVICGIIVGGLCEPVWGLAALVGSLLVSYARARAEAAGVELASVGLAERAERILLISAASFLVFVDRRALVFGVALLAILTHLTVLHRMLHVWRSSS